MPSTNMLDVACEEGGHLVHGRRASDCRLDGIVYNNAHVCNDVVGRHIDSYILRYVHRVDRLKSKLRYGILAPTSSTHLDSCRTARLAARPEAWRSSPTPPCPRMREIHIHHCYPLAHAPILARRRGHATKEEQEPGAHHGYRFSTSTTPSPAWPPRTHPS